VGYVLPKKALHRWRAKSPRKSAGAACEQSGARRKTRGNVRTISA